MTIAHHPQSRRDIGAVGELQNPSEGFQRQAIAGQRFAPGFCRLGLEEFAVVEERGRLNFGWRRLVVDQLAKMFSGGIEILQFTARFSSPQLGAIPGISPHRTHRGIGQDGGTGLPGLKVVLLLEESASQPKLGRQGPGIRRVFGSQFREFPHGRRRIAGTRQRIG